jgi:hypothetical protein
MERANLLKQQRATNAWNGILAEDAARDDARRHASCLSSREWTDRASRTGEVSSHREGKRRGLNAALRPSNSSGGASPMRNGKLVMAGLAAGAALSTPAFAHHSFAMFDNQKNLVLEGTIKEFQWTNPHSWIQVVVKDSAGKSVEWSIEGGSPNGLARSGWKRTSIKAGDKAVITIHPLKDGSPGGSLAEITVNGQKLNR